MAEPQERLFARTGRAQFERQIDLARKFFRSLEEGASELETATPPQPHEEAVGQSLALPIPPDFWTRRTPPPT